MPALLSCNHLFIRLSNAFHFRNSQPPQNTSSRMIQPPSSSTRSHLISASSNASVPAREDAESELKPFSDGEAAVKTTLKLLADEDWLVEEVI